MLGASGVPSGWLAGQRFAVASDNTCETGLRLTEIGRGHRQSPFSMALKRTNRQSGFQKACAFISTHLLLRV
jgi:hypothetical protein